MAIAYTPTPFPIEEFSAHTNELLLAVAAIFNEGTDAWIDDSPEGIIAACESAYRSGYPIYVGGDVLARVLRAAIVFGARNDP